MIKSLDDWLNSITMYRLVLYFLIVLVIISCLLALVGSLPFTAAALAFSSLFLVAVSLAANTLFSRLLDAPTNVESVYITALILALILTPARSLTDLGLLAWAAVLSMGSKYLLAIRKKHLFNPAALAVALTAFFLGAPASWWVGTSSLVLPVLAGGLLIARKIRREDMLFYFFVTAFVVSGFSATAVLGSPLLFFGFIMFTEPLTTPPTKFLQAIYAVLVGLLFSPSLHLGSFYFTPELALLTGNIFSYIVSPKDKLVLALKEKRELAPDTFEFLFPLSLKFNFTPGQYMEWTLPHSSPDGRGNRRYFTLASSPTENVLRLGVKFNHPGSSFKNALLATGESKLIVASQLAGDFALPKNPGEKLAFIAGGIGITPFRSMLKYLLDTGDGRNIILFYSNKTADEIVYRDLLDEVEGKLGVKTVYTLTDKTQIPPAWPGKTGRLDETMIREEIPDFNERKFYLSGPHSLVTAFESTLHAMGVKSSRIITDFFPGFV